MSQEERIEIADLCNAGLSIRQIAHRLGRAPSTVSRELRRNATKSRGYRPFDAHRRATARRARNHRRRIEGNGELRQLIVELLAQRWSPQQISRHLRLTFPVQSGMWLCHESIYQAVYQPGSTLLRPSRLAPQHRSPLRTGRDHRRAHQRTERRRARFEHPMLMIHQRPFPDRGPVPTGALGRRSHHRQGPGLCDRYARRTADQDGPTAAPSSARRRHPARRAEVPDGRPPAALLRSITWDQGTEMARHLTIAQSLGAPVYFCDSRSPWQRGSNENTNGLLRDYFPRGTDLSTHSSRHLLAVENELNKRPRIVLNDHTLISRSDVPHTSTNGSGADARRGLATWRCWDSQKNRDLGQVRTSGNSAVRSGRGERADARLGMRRNRRVAGGCEGRRVQLDLARRRAETAVEILAVLRPGGPGFGHQRGHAG